MDQCFAISRFRFCLRNLADRSAGQNDVCLCAKQLEVSYSFKLSSNCYRKKYESQGCRF